MFEGNTMLAGIAARARTIGLGLLVGGVTYRNPAHAKITTTLDVISGSQAFHGVAQPGSRASTMPTASRSRP